MTRKTMATLALIVAPVSLWAVARLQVPVDADAARQAETAVREARQDGNAAATLRAWRRWLEFYPNEPAVQAEIYRAMAMVYEQSGDADQARVWNGVVAQMDPGLNERLHEGGAATRGSADQFASILAGVLQTAQMIQTTQAALKAGRGVAGQTPGGQAPGMPVQNAFPAQPVGSPGFQPQAVNQPMPGYAPQPMPFAGQQPVALDALGNPIPQPTAQPVMLDALGNPIPQAQQQVQFPQPMPQQPQTQVQYPQPMPQQPQAQVQFPQPLPQQPQAQVQFPQPMPQQPQAQVQFPQPLPQQPQAQVQFPQPLPQQPQAQVQFPQPMPQQPGQSPQPMSQPQGQQYPQPQAQPGAQQYPQPQAQQYPQQAQQPRQAQQYPQAQQAGMPSRESFYPQQQAAQARPMYAMQRSSPYGAPGGYARPQQARRGDGPKPIAVFHDHSRLGDKDYFEPRCGALLMAEGGNLTFTPNGGEAPLVIPAAEVIEIRMNTAVGKEVGAFHIITRQGLYLHLAPEGATADEGHADVDELRKELGLDQ